MTESHRKAIDLSLLQLGMGLDSTAKQTQARQTDSNLSHPLRILVTWTHRQMHAHMALVCSFKAPGSLQSVVSITLIIPGQWLCELHNQTPDSRFIYSAQMCTGRLAECTSVQNDYFWSHLLYSKASASQTVLRNATILCAGNNGSLHAY